MSKLVDIYQCATDQIIAELDAGALPWVKVWHSRVSTGLTRVTSRSYLE